MAVWGKGAAAKLLLIKDGWRAFCSRAEVSVFWDLNKCGVDDEADGEWEGETAVDASHIAPNIAKSLRSSGFSGPISIRAYGNTRCLCNNHLMQALLATGVDLHHTSGVTETNSCAGTAKHLILDLLLWVRENSPPAHVLLISGDKEFSSVLHKLQMRGYNVLVAHPKADVSRDLLSAASKVWLWDNMMKGTEVSALPPKCNCLQQSPRSCNDTESRYCHNQKVNREFVDVNQDPVCHGLQQKPQNIPKKVVEQVLDVIRSKPRGFTVPAFRRQLVRSSVTLDKNLYGHNDLLSFLLSIPDLKARLVWTSDKTRTFFFTENLDESTNFNEDSKEVLSTSPDDRDIAKQATVKAAHGKRFSGSKMTNISSFQQFNNKVTIDKSSEENIAEVSSDVGLLLDDRATKKTNFFLGGTNIIMSSWNKTLFKLMALKKLWQFVGCKAAKTQQTNSRLCLIKKDEESESKNEIINAESYISSVSSSSPEGEKKSHATYKTEVQGAEGGRQKVIHHSTNYQALDDERKNRNLRLFQKSNKLQSSDCVGTQQTRTGIDLGSEGLPRHSGLHSGVGTTLHEGGINFTDAKSIKDLCDDVFIYLLKKGCTTRSITA
ncbi:hypothetical protein L7F22_027994 [Adiantum nelumboides]|nr:hypothetical protein [Adiantum nelumboides]